MRRFRDLISQYRFAVVAISLVASLQLVCLRWPYVAGYANSIMGTFLQAALVTTSFAPAAVTALRGDDLRKHRLLEKLGDLAGQGQGLQVPELEREFLQLPILKSVRNGDLRTLSSHPPGDCALFVLGYQYYGHTIRASGFDSTCLTQIAAQASGDAMYRRALLLGSLSEILPDRDALNELVARIENKTEIQFGVSSRQAEADDRLEKELKHAAGDECLIIAVTSQISRSIVEAASRREVNLSKFTIAYLSPLVLTHNAILSQLSELTVPVDVIPTSQQMVDPACDALRRVIRILVALTNCRDRLSRNAIDYSILLFTQSYPKIKVRALSKTHYCQVFPGNLEYANNIYRFGYELTDRIAVDGVRNAMGSWLSGHCVNQSLDDESIEELSDQALEEITLYLAGQPRMLQRLSEGMNQLLVTLPEPQARLLLEMVMNRLANKLSPSDSSSDSNNSDRFRLLMLDDNRTGLSAGHTAYVDDGTHVSVGCIVRRQDRILLVRKITAPNVGLWSLPAGHCEWGECPELAAPRELEEETSLKPSRLRFEWSGVIDEGVDCRHGARKHYWFVYSAKFPANASIVLQEAELGDYRWASREDVSELLDGNLMTPAAGFLARYGQLQ